MKFDFGLRSRLNGSVSLSLEFKQLLWNSMIGLPDDSAASQELLPEIC